ncbi:MAG: small, acid-soluble spore protein, alpha/beta type [Clostridia bacterium]|nr:small, acid-soluble spore protein, alpha/beta type [Clostridia bacterium]
MRMLSQKERLKYEVAEELGLLPRLREMGWAGLSTAESGRIGGIVGARMRERKKED